MNVPARGGRVEPALALLVLAPAALSLWPGPGALLADVFANSEAAAAGLVALATIPAVALVTVTGTRHRVPALGLFLVTLLVAYAFRGLTEGGDGLEASRALLTMTASLGVWLAAARLGPEGAGRKVLVHGLVVLSLLATLGAFYLRALDPRSGFAGILGNAGELASAALPGAVAGAVLLVRGPSVRSRILGAAGLVAFLAYTAASGVRAGPLAMLGACALGGVVQLATARRRDARERRSGPALLAIAGSMLATLALAGALARPSADVIASDAPPGESGLAVRLALWPRAAQLASEHPLGVGPGQFAVAFPPYRAPEEIELSSHSRRLGASTEVEHPHDDVLQAFCELGVIGGLAFVAFLAFVLFRAFTAMRDGSVGGLALGTAIFALVADGAVNGTLGSNPTAAVLAFAVAGALYGTGGSASGRGARVLPFLCLALLVRESGGALDLVRHGRALAAYAHELSHQFREPHLRDPDPRILRTAIDDALAARPDSAVALTLRAILAEKLGQPDVALESWRRVLALRPYRYEALVQSGVLDAKAGNSSAAHAAFARAAELDPTDPVLLRNRTRLELETGNVDEARALMRRLEDAGRLDEAFLRELAVLLLLSGRDRSAELPLARLGDAYRDLDGNRAYALAKSPDVPAELARALECRAQREWGREHARAGRFDVAVRSYRQSLSIARDGRPEGAPDPAPIALELAAALHRADRDVEAVRALGGVTISARDLQEVADWAQEVLMELGVR